MTYQSQLTELRGMIEKIEYYKYTTDMRLNIEVKSCLFWPESNIGCFLIPDFRS